MVSSTTHSIQSRGSSGSFISPRPVYLGTPRPGGTPRHVRTSISVGLPRLSISVGLPRLLGMPRPAGAPRGVGIPRSSGTPRPTRVLASSGGEKIRLKLHDYEKILDFLEIPGNFELLTGGGRRTRIGSRFQSKGTVFKQMVVVLQAHGFPKEINGPNLGKRFNRYVKKYKEARELQNQSGGGLNEAEVDAGITLEDKLNQICPHFERMHALYGGRANVAPPVISNHGVGDDDEYLLNVNSDSDDEPVPDGDDGDAADSLFDTDDQENEAPPSTPTILLADGPQEVVDEYHGIDVNERIPVNENDPCFLREIEEMARADHNETVEFPRREPRRPIIELSADTMPAPISSVVEGRHPLQPLNGPPPVLKKKPTGKTPAQALEDKQVTSKPAMAAIYSERLNLKAKYRKELIDTRDRWKGAELAERREARIEAKAEAEGSGKQLRKHQLLLEKKHAVNVEKKAKLDAEHAMLMAKAERKTQLLLELIRSNKSEDELSKLLDLVGYD
ncbi:unnamed protein product [Calypogeia fissa]